MDIENQIDDLYDIKYQEEARKREEGEIYQAIHDLEEDIVRTEKKIKTWRKDHSDNKKTPRDYIKHI